MDIKKNLLNSVICKLLHGSEISFQNHDQIKEIFLTKSHSLFLKCGDILEVKEALKKPVLPKCLWEQYRNKLQGSFFHAE